MKKSSTDSNGSRPRVSKNKFVTKSGATIKVRRSLTDRLRSTKDNKIKRKADRLATLPKGRVKRLFAHFEPKRMAKYWFSREGGIMALKVLGIGFVVFCLLMLGVFAYFRKDLPDLKDISGNNIGGSTRYYDRSGKVLLWEDYDSVKRIPVEGSNISPYMKDATVAVEDKDFFKHGGFDVRGIARAGVNDVFGHSGTQGGSTITQQLVKLTQDWTRDRTITRKVKELILAVELEREYSKQEILTGYLNTAPYGNVEYGVEAAARDYFHKSAKDLTLDEAAFLAAIPKSPAFYSPYVTSSFDKAAVVDRQHYILDLMAQQGKITTKQRDDAEKVDTVAAVQPPPANKFAGIKAPWFVLAAKHELEAQYSSQTVKHGGWNVITSVDMDLQGKAEDSVNKGMGQVRRQGGDTAAMVVEDVKTGQVMALVGGPDFNNKTFGENNYATDYKLPPGSSIKPYDYTTLIDSSNNVGAGSVIYDSKEPIPPGYPCTNPAPPPNPGANCAYDFSRTFNGPVTLRYAMGVSLNVPAIKAMSLAGVDKTLKVADGLMSNPNAYRCYSDDELTKPAQCGQAAAIGDGAYLTLADHVNGFTSIARNGDAIPQSFILKITDSSKKTVFQWQQPKGTQVVRPEAAYIVGNMASDPNASYFPAGNKPQVYKNSQGTWKFGVKTGTTNDSKDGWMMGFSSQYAAGVWVGYHNRQVEMSEPMEAMTQPIWQTFMRAAHANLKPVDIVQPAGIQTLPAYVIGSHSGTLYGASIPSTSTDLFPSWFTGKKGTNTKQTIDTVSNKVATDCTPALAKKDTLGGNVNSFSIDSFHDKGIGTNASTTTDKDDVHHCDDTKPSVTVTAAPNGDGTTYSITATATAGTYPFSDSGRSQFPGTINISVDGQVIQTFTDVSDSPSTRTVPNQALSPGSHTVTAQIIDSVLYDSTDSTTVDVSAPVVTPSLILQNPSVSGNGVNKKTTFSWTGNTGTVTIFNALSNAILCSGAGNCQVPFTTAPTGTNAYGKDTGGTQSNTVTVGP